MSLNWKVITLCFVVALPGCGEDSDGATTGGPEPTYATPCPVTHPVPLVTAPETEEELEYLDDITACTDAANTTTYLNNDSDVVWTLLTTAGGDPVEQLTQGIKLESFRELALQVYEFELLFPKSAVVVGATPGDVVWRLHPQLSAMWLFHEQAADSVEEYGQEQLTELLAMSSLRRGALATCSFAAYNIVQDDLSGLTGDNPIDQFLAGLGIASEATQCSRAWQLADEDALRRFDQTATWGDDVARWADDTTFLRYADDQLTLLRRLGKALVILR